MISLTVLFVLFVCCESVKLRKSNLKIFLEIFQKLCSSGKFQKVQSEGPQMERVRVGSRQRRDIPTD
jgi:hypothetical protein